MKNDYTFVSKIENIKYDKYLNVLHNQFPKFNNH